jgi:hypothetical protein
MAADIVQADAKLDDLLTLVAILRAAVAQMAPGQDPNLKITLSLILASL